VVYSNFIEFGVCMKLGRLTKIYLSETYSNVCRSKYLCDSLPMKVRRADNLTAICEQIDGLDNMGSLTFYNPIGLHGLLQG
jgi:hypothetical protein